DFSGDATFTITTDDRGRYAPYLDDTHLAINHQSATDTFNISVVAEGPGPRPSATVPRDQAVAAANILTSPNGNHNAVSPFDPEAGRRAGRVTSSVTSGTNDWAATFTGTYADINSVLSGLAVIKARSPAPTVASPMPTDDQGLTGSGDP